MNFFQSKPFQPRYGSTTYAILKSLQEPGVLMKESALIDAAQIYTATSLIRQYKIYDSNFVLFYALKDKMLYTLFYQHREKLHW